MKDCSFKYHEQKFWNRFLLTKRCEIAARCLLYKFPCWFIFYGYGAVHRCRLMHISRKPALYIYRNIKIAATWPSLGQHRLYKQTVVITRNCYPRGVQTDAKKKKLTLKLQLHRMKKLFHNPLTKIADTHFTYPERL